MIKDVRTFSLLFILSINLFFDFVSDTLNLNNISEQRESLSKEKNWRNNLKLNLFLLFPFFLCLLQLSYIYSTRIIE